MLVGSIVHLTAFSSADNADQAGPAYLEPFIHIALTACIPAPFDHHHQQMKTLMSYPHAADLQVCISAYGPQNPFVH